MGETLYSSSYQPDPGSARDVLAFVLTPVEAFAQADDPEELKAVDPVTQRSGEPVETITLTAAPHLHARAAPASLRRPLVAEAAVLGGVEGALHAARLRVP